MKPPETSIDWFVVQGPRMKSGRDGLEVRFNRHGFEGYRVREIVLASVYPGDGEFRRSVQQAIVRFPLKAREGKVENPSGFYILEGRRALTRRAMSSSSRSHHERSVCHSSRSAPMSAGPTERLSTNSADSSTRRNSNRPKTRGELYGRCARQDFCHT